MGGMRFVRSVGDVATACFMGAISGLADLSGVALLLFPELGALSYDVIRRPHGAWASAPGMLILTPFLTGLVGTVTTRNLPYGLLSIAIVVVSAIVIIRLLHSPIAPAIAAGLLPLTLGQPSWWYAPSLLVGSSLLAGIAMIRRRLHGQPAQDPAARDQAKASSHPAEQDATWLPFFAVFLALAASGAALTGVRFMLFPPLVVIGFEMFAHFEKCPWSPHPILIPVICGITATASLLMVDWLGTGTLVVALSVLFSACVVRSFKLHFPPAIAVGLLPFVIDKPDFRYPVAVIAGAMLLSIVFLLWRRRQHRQTEKSPCGATTR